MVERSGRFRVYRVVESVPHLNLQAVDEATLYTVYQSGYGDLQTAVDGLRTGDLVEATLTGDPTAEEEAWRLTGLERVGGVEMGFAVGVDPPAVAREQWTPGQSDPTCAVLTEDDEPVGVCCVQPRESLPGGTFVPKVLTGLVPLEPQLASIPSVGDPAAEALFLDPDPPDATDYTVPYGVVMLFSERASSLPDRFREAYDCPRGGDSRPDFDPYGV
jgi:hypothetical protein